MSKESAVASIIPEFHGATDDWNVYREILEEFYRAHGITGEARVPVLISVIGKDTYRTLRDLCHPRSPKQMDYDELCKVLARQFIPEIAIFRRRSKFYRAEQARGESVKDWYARLKALSVDCAFAEVQLEPLLLDRFVLGLAPGPVQDRLYEERPDNLTLERVVDLAAAKEATLTKGEGIAVDIAMAYIMATTGSMHMSIGMGMDGDMGTIVVREVRFPIVRNDSSATITDTTVHQRIASEEKGITDTTSMVSIITLGHHHSVLAHGTG
uniref:Retrotransposon gag domain-containing protein n=1 Tax=Anopheles atroparvus TaxID=41427 RepID=A0A182IJI1_ANOAO